MISVPTINVSRLEEVPPQVAAPDEPVAAVLMHMLGDLTGRTLLVFPKPTAVRLAELMLRRPRGIEHGARRDGAVGDQGGRATSSAART